MHVTYKRKVASHNSTGQGEVNECEAPNPAQNSKCVLATVAILTLAGADEGEEHILPSLGTKNCPSQVPRDHKRAGALPKACVCQC